MKGYRYISIKEKLLIVSEVIAGKKIQVVADRYKVSRPSVYAWSQKALDTLEKALKLEKRGPKLRRVKFEAKDREIKERRGEIDRLKDIIKEKEKQIENLKRKVSLQKRDVSRPLKCPHCGFEKIYRNGTYKVKIDKFFDKLKKDGEKEILIQQFICPYCNSIIHPSRNKRRIIFL